MTTQHPWHQAQLQLRARTREPAAAPAQTLASLSGLEFLQAILQATVPDPQIARTLDFHLLEVELGRAVFQGLPAFAHYNPISTVHGGWHATLLDSALACAVQSVVGKDRADTTLEFEVHGVRPLTDRAAQVRAEGKVVAGGRRMATAEGRLVDCEGRLCSHGTTDCRLLDLQP